VQYIPCAPSFARERLVNEVDAGVREERVPFRAAATPDSIKAVSAGSDSFAETIASRNASPWPTNPEARPQGRTRVSAHVAGALAVDDRRGGEVDLGVIDRERLADLSAGSRGERARDAAER